MSTVFMLSHFNKKHVTLVSASIAMFVELTHLRSAISGLVGLGLIRIDSWTTNCLAGSSQVPQPSCYSQFSQVPQPSSLEVSWGTWLLSVGEPH